MIGLPLRRFTEFQAAVAAEFNEFQAAVAAEFDIRVWVAAIMLSLALIGFCLVSYVVFRIAPNGNGLAPSN
jgi:hypothetical protein